MTAGLIAGCLITILDRPPASVGGRTIDLEDPGPDLHLSAHPRIEQGSLIGRVLALLGVLFCCLPFVGLGLCIAAYLMNRHARGWPARTIRIGMAVSTLSAIAGLILMVLGPRQ